MTFLSYHFSLLYLFSKLHLILDREKYFLFFGVSYVEIPGIVTEVLLFHQSCPKSPVSILKTYVQQLSLVGVPMIHPSLYGHIEQRFSLGLVYRIKVLRPFSIHQHNFYMSV